MSFKQLIIGELLKIIVHDNGLLDRKDMEALASEIPAFCWKPVDVFIAYSISGNQLLMSYHKRKKIFGIHIPDTYAGTRSSLLKELVVTLQAVGDYGVIPNNLTPLKVQKYLQNWEKFANAKSI
jgi:hypothetical protein